VVHRRGRHPPGGGASVRAGERHRGSGARGVYYAIDFAILQLPAGEFVGIEVDGFDYHDRTPEQAERDRARDRALMAAGWVVLRFAAREVIRDADACVQEVLRFLRRASGVLRVTGT